MTVAFDYALTQPNQCTLNTIETKPTNLCSIDQLVSQTFSDRLDVAE